MMITPNNIPQGYKATPLGIIPQEWEVRRLGDIVSITSGESPSLYHLKTEGKYPYVKVEDLNNCEKYQIISREYSDDNNIIVKAGSIIFPKRGASILNNKVRIAAKNIQMDSNMMAITPNTAIIDSEFLFVRILYEKLYRIADTSSIPQINNKHIIPYKIPVPPLAEQKKIAEILGVWDKAIEKQSQLIEQLTLRKRGLMQQLLTAKRRLPGFSDPWKKVRLGDIAQCFSGGTPKAGRNEYYDGNIPFIRSGEIHQKDTELFLSKLGMAESSAKMVQKGDLLMALYGANSGDVSISQIDGAINQAILCIRPRNVLVSFLCPFLNLNKDMYIAKYLQGGQGNLSGEIVLNYKIPVPPLAEQTAIAQVLTAADREIELAQQKLELLRQQKRGLMQQLLTGKKRVKY